MKTYLANETETAQLAAKLADIFCPPLVIYLRGDLGAGKTAMVRHLLRSLNYAEVVRSPTYTLLEQHQLVSAVVHHLDLYRLTDPEELNYLGLRDIDTEQSLWFIEWPERGEGYLPLPDIEITLIYQEDGRCVSFSGITPAGKNILEMLDL